MTVSNGKYRHDVEEWLDCGARPGLTGEPGFFAGSLDIIKVPSFRHQLGFRISVIQSI